jgi:tetratricopeptide (TPR) repeat protein
MPSKMTPGPVFVLAGILTFTATAQTGGVSEKRAQRPTAKPAGRPEAAMIVLQQKPNFVLWDAEKKIEPGAVGLAYRVEKVDRFRLLLTAPGHGLRGWSPSSEVISLELAEAFFNQAIVIRPNEPFAYLMRAITRAENGDADGALADLDKVLERDPKYVPALVRRASLLRARGRFDRAIADLDRAIAIDGREPSARVERAVLWFTRKEYGQASTDLDRASGLGSRDINVHILRGRILLERKDTRRAYEAFVSALKVDPSRHDAYLGLASVFLMRGQPKHAQAVLDDAVRADPNNPEAYGNRATFYLTRHDDEKALFNLGEVIRLSPGSARAHNERAWLLATCRDEKLRDPRQAVELARRACELTAWQNPRYLATLAAAYSEISDFAAAVHNQKRAVELLDEKAPETAEYHRLLNRYRMKKPRHALGVFQELGILSVPAATGTNE